MIGSAAGRAAGSLKPARDKPPRCCVQGIEHKRTIVIRVVVRAQPRRAIVLAARRERRAVERINHRPIFRDDCDVHRLFQLAFAVDPEIRFAAAAETSGGLSCLLRGRLHRVAVRRSQWLVRLPKREILGMRFGALPSYHQKGLDGGDADEQKGDAARTFAPHAAAVPPYSESAYDQNLHDLVALISQQPVILCSVTMTRDRIWRWYSCYAGA